MDRIKEFWLATNYSCNNRCAWCYTEPKNFDATLMPFEYAVQVMDEMKRIGANKCTLLGGEPTLHPRLFDMISYGAGLGLVMKIVTNGTLLSDINFVRELKKSGISIIALSIHGSTEEMHKRITGSDNLEKSVEAIRNCLSEDMELVTLTNINGINKDVLFDVASFLNELGVKNIVFNIAVPSDCSDGRSSEYILHPREIARLIEATYKELLANNIKAGFYASIPLCIYDKEILDEMIRDKYMILLSDGGCSIYSATGVGFDPMGNLVPCAKKLSTSLVNTMTDDKFIYTNSFYDVWNKVKHNFGKENWEYESDKCHDCEMNEYCIGGCPLFWNKFDFEESIK